MRHFFLFIGLLGFSQLFQAQIPAIDQQRLDLQLQLNPAIGQVVGEVELQFRLRATTKDSIALDAINMEVETFELNGQSIRFVNDGKTLRFPTPTSDTNALHSLRIHYSVYPRKGIYFNGWDERGARPQVFTQGQGIDHRHWIPHQDDQRDKLLMSLQLVFPNSYQVISNGVLKGREEIGDSIRWHFETLEPMSSYLLALAIGEYKVEKVVASTEVPHPMEHYYYSQSTLAYPLLYGSSASLMAWMESAIGVPFPWTGAYRQVPVANFKHGAMENTCAVIIGDIFLQDAHSAFIDRSYLEIQAHELAHHWFGNYVTSTATHSHWFHEGFATYWQWQAVKKFEGNWRAQRARLMALHRVESTASQLGDFSIEEEKAGSVGFYDKGGWVVSMLTDWLDSSGQQLWLSHYLEEHAYGLTTGKEVFAYLAEEIMPEAQIFYEGWVEGSVLPQCKLEPLKNGEWRVQNPSRLPFVLEIGALLKDGSTWNWRAPIADREVQIKVPSNAIVVLPDPRARLLCSWQLKSQSITTSDFWSMPDSWRSQYLRLYGLSAFNMQQLLRDMPESVAAPETFWTMAHLAKGNEKWIPLLIEMALGQSEADVLVDALLESCAMPAFAPESLANTLWNRNTYRSREQALTWMFQNQHPELASRCMELLQQRAPAIQSHQVRAALYLHLTGNSKGSQVLRELASAKEEFVTRSMAFEALQNGSRPIWDEEIALDALTDYFNPNSRIAVPCRQYFKAYLQAEGVKDIQKEIKEITKSWSDKQLEAFEKQTGLN